MKRDFGCGTLIAIILVVLLLAFAISCIQAAIALWLWNAVVVVAFSAPVLSFWQMYGLIWLVHIFLSASYASSVRSSRKDY